MNLGQIAWNTNKDLPNNDTIILAKLKDEYIYDYELPYVVAKIYNNCIHINDKAYSLKIIDMWAYIEGRTLY